MTARVTSLRFEHRPAGEAAFGLGERAPRLSWIASDAPDGWTQAAYEVEIIRTPWAGESATSSQVIESRESLLVAWPAEPLASREHAEVRIRVKGSEWGPWSDAAVVEAGLAPDDWTARFISPRDIGAHRTPAPAVSSTFEVPGEVAAARLHLSAHGMAEVHLNGVRVGDDWFAPGWTSYHNRVRVYAYDVTDLVSSGGNTLDVLLGNGWFRGRLGWEGKTCHYGDRLAALAQLEVVTTDGATFALATDGSWHARTTNILFDDLYDGETQDRQLPLLGAQFTPVDVLDDSVATLVAPEGPPVRVTEVVPAQRVWRSPSGKLLVDFGQNVVGFPRLTVHGLAAGSEIVITQAEVLEHDELGTRPLRSAKCTDRYLLAGDSEEVLQPHFTFHGFRYASVDGVDDLDASDIEAVVLGSGLTRTGWFESSHELVNQLHSNVVWGMRGNFLDVPTDCPQRDERLGWTGDIQVFSPTAAYLHDSFGNLSSWLKDLAAEQHEDGNVPVVIPNVISMAMPAAAWGDAATIVPWNLYLASGDAEILRRQFASMRGWVDKITSIATGDLWLGGFQFGDWLDPDAPPEQPGKAKADIDVVATACWYRCAKTVSEAALVLGESAIAADYSTLADRVKAGFQRRFVTPDGLIHSDAPTVYAQAICWGLLDDQQLRYAGDRLADLARLAGFRVSTGFIGTPLITEALTLTGHHDTAIRLVEETGCPSWLY
ncbi:MAG TPA: family 78 glycoside hydrolase catalytic domain, partial [Propionibacteriaceae bacterium]|nr:family 78 glycoside hydrolase catalytic domain [Propionibacteriaceae bacterium]